jgi:hypothetical protein
MAEGEEITAVTSTPEFIDDVEGYINKSSSPDAAIESLRQRIQQCVLAENQVLARRQRLGQQEADLKKSLDCVCMIASKHADGPEMVLDYSLGGTPTL